MHKQKGFTPPQFLSGGKSTIAKHGHGRPVDGKNHSKKTGAGFTLIELLVVIAIIGLLASIVTVSINQARQKARDAKRVADINQLAKAFEMYIQDNPNGTYPTGWFDSRPWFTAPNDWSTLKPFLVPKYITQMPVAPMNGQQDGAMCGNCDEYKYVSNARGTAFGLCTYLATNAPTGTQNVTGYNMWGPYYCVNNGCDPSSVMTGAVCP